MSNGLIFSRCLRAVTAVIGLAALGSGPVYADAGGQHGDHKAMEPMMLSAEGKNVVKALEGYASAVESGNIDEVEKYVVADEGFTSLEGASMDQGWASYRKHMGAEMPMFKDMRYEFSNIQPFVSGDLAYATLDYVMDFTIESDRFEGGKHELSMKGKGTMVLSKAGDAWKIRHVHTAREQAKRSGSGSNPH